jgi:triosephosphate isomerase
LIAANWKMHKSLDETRAFARDFLPRVAGAPAEVAIAPPFTALATLAEALAGSAVALAAQNSHTEASGAFTGEISPDMLADLGCRYGIVGHSERRALFGETDAFVCAKAGALLERSIRPIVCVGETLDEREGERAEQVVSGQLEGSLAGIGGNRAEDLVVAYEPVWAIGTGKTATPEIAQEMHAAIRATLTKLFGAGGEAMRILYGGSVKPDNAATLMAAPDIDGALVGGASLAPDSFAAIVHAAGAG